MDRIEDLVILAFLIISFLASILKKKKQREKRTASAQKPEYDVSPAPVKPAPDKQQFEKAVSEVDQWFEQFTGKKYSEEEQIPDYSENTVSENVGIPVKNEPLIPERDKSPVINETKAKPLLSQIIDNKTLNRKSDSAAAEIKRKLLKGKSIRDYIVVSEIIGKPKALSDI